jgi:putative inorganic carbon (HCO3(-)) transporter
MSRLTHYADKTIEYLFYALFFFTPLILWPGTSEVFEFNKMLFVYLITVLIAASWIFKWIIQKKITIRRTPLDLPILLFLASQVLSTIFSIDTHTSLYGYYSRFHGGLISTISYITLYYAFVSNIKPPTIRFVIYTVLSSAALVAFYAILEHFGIDKSLWVQDVQNRVFSTLGQPNWLSAYLVAILPIPIFLAISSKNKKISTCYLLLATCYLLLMPHRSGPPRGAFARGASRGGPPRR